MTTQLIEDNLNELGIVDTMMFGCLPSGFQLASRTSAASALGDPILRPQSQNSTAPKGSKLLAAIASIF